MEYKYINDGIPGIEIWMPVGGRSNPTIYFVDPNSKRVHEHWEGHFQALYEWLDDDDRQVYLYTNEGRMTEGILMIKLEGGGIHEV